MKLELKGIVNSNKKNQVEISIRTMMGDADGYDTENIYLGPEYLDMPSDDPRMLELEMFIECINECIRRDSNGRGGIDSTMGFTSHYADIGNENFGIFCGSVKREYLDVQDLKDPSKIIQFRACTCTYGEFYNSFESIEVFYYDENGIKFNVEII